MTQPVDFHLLAHRGLTQELIPRWLRENSKDLDGQIESSAYGETPADLLIRIFELLDLKEGDAFLDLGAGGGGLLPLALQCCSSVFGLERNPVLVRAGREALEQVGLEPQILIQADFLTDSWPAATKVFAASSRFSERTLLALQGLLQSNKALTHLVFLGGSPQLEAPWQLTHRSEQMVSWNEGEPVRAEDLRLWYRA